MTESKGAAYKRLHRLMERVDPREVLLRLFAEQSPFVLGDPTEIEGLFKALVAEGIHFVIRLNPGSHSPRFTDAEGEEVDLHILPGQKVIWRGVFYQGQVEVNLIGVWKQALKEPLWVITDLEPEEGWRRPSPWSPWPT